jgi:hypothetical protein
VHKLQALRLFNRCGWQPLSDSDGARRKFTFEIFGFIDFSPIHLAGRY